MLSNKRLHWTASDGRTPFHDGVTSPACEMPWRNTAEMLAVTLGAMRHDWVRDWLLHKEDGSIDAQIMTDGRSTLRTMAALFEGNTVRQGNAGFNMSVVNLRVNWPAFTRGGYGTGVAVANSDGLGSHRTVFSQWRFYRFVAHSARSELLNVTTKDDSGMVECDYQRHMPNGLWLHVKLMFNRAILTAAFRDGADFFAAQTALIQSTVCSVYHHAPVRLCGGEYPYKVADNVGRHAFRSVLTSYLDATPTMAIPVRFEGQWSFSCDTRSRALLQRWGVANRMKCLNLSPVTMPHADTGVAIVVDSSLGGTTTTTEDSSSVEDLDRIIDDAKAAALSSSPTNNNVPAEQPRPFVRIAPTRTVHPVNVLTAEERAQQEKYDRRERRKIRMREAAARYNERKRRERLEVKRRQAMEMNCSLDDSSWPSNAL